MNSIFVLCTVNPCEVTVHAQEKKKKLKNVKRGRRIQLNPNAHYVTVWIQRFSFFFCFHAFQGERRQILLFMRQMSLFMHCSSTVHRIHIHFIQNKNGSHGTIHTFKNYFVTVFSVFNFSNNKFNPNGPYKLDANAILSPFAHKKKM